MGLFGALFAGVSGLNSQSNKIGIISNNISNANTVGFKQSSADFNTLVVPSGSTAFSPGGVIGESSQLVNQQGLIQATSSATDVAITGNGLMVVNSAANGTGTQYYTRAGSFTQDALGNFVNSDGYYLQGFPLDAQGVPANTNFSNLTSVNVSSSAIGSATATSDITIAANFNATQQTLLGYTETATLAGDSTNVSNTAADIMIPTTVNGLTRGKSFTITSGGDNQSVTYTYGGFSKSRDITNNASAGNGDGANTLLTGTGSAVNNTSLSIGTTGQVTISVADIADYINNGVNDSTINIQNFAGTITGSGLTAAEINGQHTILSTNVTAGTVTFQSSATTSTATTASGAGTFNITNRGEFFQGNVLDATSPSGNFLSQTPLSDFSADALKFTATVAGTTYTFGYNGTPDATQGQFNSMATLASAINQSTNGAMQANVGPDNRLYISATNPNDAVTYANVDATPSSAGDGINWVQELDLPATAITNVNAGANANANPPQYYFNSLASLATQINTSDPNDLIATVVNPTGASTLTISETNPQQTITFSDNSSFTTTANVSGGSLVAELGLTSSGGGSLTVENTDLNGNKQYTTGALPITYNPQDPTKNMSSGAVPAQFSKDITIYDAQGNSHTVALNVAKLGTDSWAVEVTAVPATDTSNGNLNAQGKTDGQLAYGVISFKGSGGFQGETKGNLLNPITVGWTNGAAQSTISLNLSGLTQTASASGVSVANQNGSSVGELTGVSIDSNGFVVASFSNGQTQKMFQVPLANVNNPDGLQAVSGDAFQQTIASGQANLSLAGTNGVGTFSSSALEQSNVDISTQLTNLIVAQQAYGANSKVLTIADQLLQELDQIIQ